MKKILIGVFFLIGAMALLLLFSNDAFIFVFRKKVWAHKVNTIEKKREAIKKFQGVEVDLVYQPESGVFDVNHPPDTSINLSSSDYLKADPDPSPNYWFDLKNLNESNAGLVCQKLDSLVSALHLNKKNIVVESHRYAYLKLFATKGFLVSYYLPTLHKIKGDSLVRTIAHIKEAIQPFPYLFISSVYKDYPLLKQHFPERTKLLWWSGSQKNFWNWKGKFHLYRMTSDKTVKVLLVPFQAKFGNR